MFSIYLFIFFWECVYECEQRFASTTIIQMLVKATPSLFFSSTHKYMLLLLLLRASLLLGRSGNLSSYDREKRVKDREFLLLPHSFNIIIYLYFNIYIFIILLLSLTRTDLIFSFIFIFVEKLKIHKHTYTAIW